MFEALTDDWVTAEPQLAYKSHLFYSIGRVVGYLHLPATKVILFN